MTAGLLVEVPARPEDIAVLRAALRTWLTANHTTESHTDDVLLGITEAVTNCVEHAYRGAEPNSVRLTADITPDNLLRVVVTDQGQWRAPQPQPTDVNVALRGRGLSILRAVAASVHIEPGSADRPGTMVTAVFALAGARLS